jgi:hypothetical protein
MLLASASTGRLSRSSAVAIIFFVFQRYFVRGAAEGAEKG